MNSIDDQSIDLIITDPPYGVGFSKGFDDSLSHVTSHIAAWFQAMSRILKDGSHIYIFIPTVEVGLWVTEANKYFTLKNILSARTYTSGTYLKDNYYFNNQLVLFLHKGKGKKFKEYDIIPTSEAWFKDKRNKNPKPYTYAYPAFLPDKLYANTRGSKKKRHPAEKNPELIKFFIGVSSNPGDVVLDPFMGGGSTGIACAALNREFIGIELNPKYYNMATQRIKEVQNETN
jgi:site-specific DNA-methyltransferase (adenine-specific)